MNGFPHIRLRRLRLTASHRRLFDSPIPGPDKFIWPIFVRAGSKSREPINSMPGQFRFGIETLLSELEKPVSSGIGGILIFGSQESDLKDDNGSEAWNPAGLVQRTVAEVKRTFPDLIVFTDVCLCAYTRHGHCGPVDANGLVINDAACAALTKVAVSHAEAGADGVAPSAMMDGQVAGIRHGLAEAGFDNTLLMSYSTKFASSMYGPFREAEQSSPGKGDRQGYQVSWRDAAQALRESVIDESEGADILMVKPALFYLDIITRLRRKTKLPIAAYNVSGEYAMLMAAAKLGAGDLRFMVRESIFGIRRAGADLIISYWAGQYKELFSE